MFFVGYFHAATSHISHETTRAPHPNQLTPLTLKMRPLASKSPRLDANVSPTMGGAREGGALGRMGGGVGGEGGRAGSGKYQVCARLNARTAPRLVNSRGSQYWRVSALCGPPHHVSTM